MDPIAVLLTALWAMLPAYVPNNVAVLAGGGRPIDGGRTLGASRVLGDGKTWRGTVLGALAGVALAQGLDIIGSEVGTTLGVTLPSFPLGPTLALPIGAMLGDLLASFLKRRTGRERGAAAPGLDQLDFVVGGLLATIVVSPAWFSQTFTVPVLLVVVVVTPILHVATNGIAYVLGLKNEPW
jgi:CDP-2,3-bis-(O-geranylgeranyl)-sn-glycerol synthase